MKKRLLGIILLMLTAFGLSGCHAVGEKAESLSSIYIAVAVISFLLLIAYVAFVRKRMLWFTVLFFAVFVVNFGYAFLSVSTSLEMALAANRIAYLGSVILPLSMLMIIMEVTAIGYNKRLPAILIAISSAMFLICASQGILDIYYKEVSFAVVNGAATLVKVYGVLHPLYLVYLLGYFAAMIAAIIRASVKKTVSSTSYAVVLAIAVLVNIGVWFIEQIADFTFEFLSISYIITELFLLGVRFVMAENQRLRALVDQKEELLRSAKEQNNASRIKAVTEQEKEYFQKGESDLTPTERAIYEAYLRGESTKKIMENLGIKENTLKFHNKNIYGKLGVSSRKQLIEVHGVLMAEHGSENNIPKGQ